jgi:hypothetical protein
MHTGWPQRRHNMLYAQHTKSLSTNLYTRR